MRAFLEIIRLELTALVRSKAVAFLLVASVAWVLAFPSLVRGDGTPAGAREIDIHFSLGGVFCLLVVALLASATGSLARERAAKRLQLTLVRPVRRVALVLGKTVALTAAGAAVLAVACGVLACRVDLRAPCSHVLAPELPPLEDVVAKAYVACLADTNTPAEVRSAPKAAVLRLLAARETERCEQVATNATAAWRFPAAGDALRVRFMTAFASNAGLRGVFRSGAASCVVSNGTKAVVALPLAGATDVVTLENTGRVPLLLRPRRDIHLLQKADAFLFNLLRAYAALVSTLALVIAFGLFLGACLSRPVALFVAFVVLAVGEMSPSVVEQYPDWIAESAADRIGLAITRFAASATRPLTSDSPLEALATDVCVEPSRVARQVGANLVAIPVLLALLGAFLLPRKQDDLV